MLKYTPINCSYPGNEKMRMVTIQKINQPANNKQVGSFTREQLKEAKQAKRIVNMTQLQKHACKGSHIPYTRACVWCGGDTHFVCNICKDANGKPIPLHLNPKKGNWKNNMCFIK